jgi:aspartyl-tRNA(Asn)/glutamyl-tRNA(Gln) amidotransferase subunit A
MGLRDIAQTSELIRRGEISPVEVLRDCLQTIERLNPSLNAFITITAHSAQNEAAQAEAEIPAGRWRGPLHGIPIGLKDLIDTAGVRTTAASGVYENRIPTEDAAVVRKLRTAGAVFVGKQNLHEFAYGGSSVISHFGPVHNPVNPEYIAGGSSGGSAAAVASGMCFAAIGTDTAGSIREPAALCGIVGLKPTYDLVSSAGVIPLSKSLDHVGPLTRTVEDAAILLDALAGEKKYQSALKDPVAHLTIGIPRKFFFDELDADVERAVDAAIRQLEGDGFSFRDVDVPVSTDRTLQAAESYAFHRETMMSSTVLYRGETLRRLRTGEKIIEAQYANAVRELAAIRQSAPSFFEDVDLLITPTTPCAAPRLADLTQDLSRLRPTELRLLRNTRPVNVWGGPAISIPCGRTSEGLPIGLQLVAPSHDEAMLLRVARRYEQLRGSS